MSDTSQTVDKIRERTRERTWRAGMKYIAGLCPQAGVHGLNTKNNPRVNYEMIDVVCKSHATTGS